jgi:hypothetical protein
MVSVLSHLLEEAEADEGAGEMQEREHRGSLTVEAQSEAAVGEHPRICPFDYPPVSTAPLA